MLPKRRTPQFCTVGQCHAPSMARGKCANHYQMWLRERKGSREQEMDEQLEGERRPKWEYLGRENELIAEQETKS
jgi:hypothetical protein